MSWDDPLKEMDCLGTGWGELKVKTQVPLISESETWGLKLLNPMRFFLRAPCKYSNKLDFDGILRD